MAPPRNKMSYKAQRRPLVCSALALAALATCEDSVVPGVKAFQPSYKPPASLVATNHARSSSRLFLSVGDGPPRQPPPEGDNGDDGLGDFLMPKKESESLKKAREYMSETSLPISFEMQPDEDTDEDTTDDETRPADDGIITKDEMEELLQKMSKSSEADGEPLPEGGPDSSALVGAFGAAGGPPSLFLGGEPSAAALAKNPYMQVVSKLTPSELISKFTVSANPRVQDAVRSTVLGLIGSLPKMAFDTTTITTGQRLASLMFQLQMTGYMLKNADYRLSLSQSLGVTNGAAYSSNMLLTGTELDGDDEDREDPLTSGKIKGKIKVRYVGSNLFGTADSSDGTDVSDSDADSPSGGVEIEVDAAAYMSELRAEVSNLKEELSTRTEQKEEALRKDLLLYIRTLPAQELRSLTNTMSQDVLVCMKGLVQTVLGGIGEGQIGPETVTEQSGEAMAQLCMWQLAVGYNLRELEVREEMKKSLENILDEDFNGGLDGTLE